MYENRHKPVIQHKYFLRRMLRHFALATGLVLVSLVIGIVGFRFIGQLAWIDATVDSSMLLSGMGPVYCGNIATTAGKLFASVYALFAGFVFLAVIGLVLAPIFHRFLHKFHADEDPNQ